MAFLPLFALFYIMLWVSAVSLPLIAVLAFFRLRQIDRSLRSIAQSLDVLSSQRFPTPDVSGCVPPLETSARPRPIPQSAFGR